MLATTAFGANSVSNGVKNLWYCGTNQLKCW